MVARKKVVESKLCENKDDEVEINRVQKYSSPLSMGRSRLKRRERGFKNQPTSSPAPPIAAYKADR